MSNLSNIKKIVERMDKNHRQLIAHVNRNIDSVNRAELSYWIGNFIAHRSRDIDELMEAVGEESSENNNPDCYKVANEFIHCIQSLIQSGKAVVQTGDTAIEGAVIFPFDIWGDELYAIPFVSILKKINNNFPTSLINMFSDTYSLKEALARCGKIHRYHNGDPVWEKTELDVVGTVWNIIVLEGDELHIKDKS